LSSPSALAHSSHCLVAGSRRPAGATVFCTGRTTGSIRSEYNRAETIEETAELVTRLGGTGIAAAVGSPPARATSVRFPSRHGRVVARA
jgi:hypothetical protein